MVAESFVIEWSILEDMWDEALRQYAEHPPGSYDDRNGMVMLGLLYGPVQIWQDGKPLVPLELLHRSWLLGQEYCQSVGIPMDPEPLSEALAGPHASVPQLACYLADYLAGRVPIEHRTGRIKPFRDMEGGPTINFQPDGDQIVITSSWTFEDDEFPDYRLVVPRPVFEQGARTFIADVARTIAARAASLLAWETLGPLRPYLPPPA